jgi:hypothetical protein
VSRPDVEGKRTPKGQMTVMNGLSSVSDCFRRILAALLGNGPVAIRTDPPSRTHRNSCTSATTPGVSGNLCSKSQCARLLRSPRRPRLQRLTLTQCLTLRTDTT